MRFFPPIVLPSDICSHIQRAFSFSPKAILNGSARFNDPKPQLLQVSDDTWASLKLRLDPLAQEIFDPRKIYFGASSLCLIVLFVFHQIKPHFDLEDADFYYDYVNRNGDDQEWDDFWANNDIKYNEWMYNNETLRSEISMWRISLILSILGLSCVTFAVTFLMEYKNRNIDAQIEGACTEIRTRFEQEGYQIDYRTRKAASGPIIGHFFPDRIICFQELNQVGIGQGKPGQYHPHCTGTTSIDSNISDNPLYGVINVIVPKGYNPGQVVNVMTPSGVPIMVAVPSGLEAGQSFPVQIPIQMYDSARA
eukprot:CAMPEP_0184868114 /NCGR_PEP_ID=MMETSP0580-20130426/29190_1 /TAXON_ID=1118495 /ORGANISM="Dactyliosolen fragilissimus" /LENGTH=307 /DNA_ID=CAMNT_0027368779 /DNA_START=78 /DNA_END=1001 /DNA_ORIENTATION=-